MRYFQRLLREMHDTVREHRAGEVIRPPSLLGSIQIDGRRLSYLEMGINQKGKAPAYLLIHGFGGFFMDWPRVFVPLSKKHHLFAIDLPGWGFSEPIPSKRKEMDVHVRTIQEFIEAQKLDEVYLMGISYGAAVAWACAALKVPKVKKILLLNPMPPHPLRYMGSWVYRLVFFMNQKWTLARVLHRFLTRAQYKLITKENLYKKRLLDSFYLKMGFLLIKQPHIARSIYEFAHLAQDIDWDYWREKMKEIEIPTTIIQGLDDRVFSIQSARDIQLLIPKARLIEFRECGHALIFDQPRKLLAFLLKRF